MMTGNANTNSETLTTLPLLHVILSIAGRINNSQISIEETPILTLSYDGTRLFIVEVERSDRLQTILDECVEQLENLDFYKDFSIAIRLR